MAPGVLNGWRIAVVAAALSGCGTAPTLPSESPDYSGLVGSVSRNGGVTSAGLLLTAGWAGLTGNVDVVIQIPEHHVLFVSLDGGAPRQGRATEIVPGDRLNVWSEGDCLRSLPPICRARDVLLLKPPGRWAAPPGAAAIP